MRLSLKSIASLIMLALLLSPTIAEARDAFVGKWKITVTPEEGGEGKEFKDTIEFKGGNFTAEAFNKIHRFKAVKYEEDTRGGLSASFTAEVKDQKDADGSAKWSGFSTGVEMQGELVWTKPDGTEVRYTFRGTKSG